MPDGPKHSLQTGANLHVPGYCQNSDPGAVGAGKYWIDTSGGTGAWILKIRNATNDGWESNAIATAHARAHAIDSASDHSAATGADKGRYAHANASTGAVEWVDLPAASGNLPGVNRHLRITLIDPKAVYGKDHEVCLIPKTDAALTITNLEVTCDGNPTTEPTGDLKRADAFIGLANAAVINDFDTTDGARSDGSITSGAVGAGKCVYLSFDAEPDAAITQMCFDITYDYD